MSKKNIILSHLTGVICAVGLSVLVSVFCKYNFFLMLLLFVALYVVIGVLAELLRNSLSVERTIKVIKSSDKEGESSNGKNEFLPNKDKAAIFAKALKNRAEKSAE